MAKMIPDIDSKKINNSGEKAVYSALNTQLPNGWVVRYHYPFCWKDGFCLKDGEADFIVIAPKYGLMFIEVKGSYGFDCKDGKWFRVKRDGTREVIESPFEQAMRAKHRIVERIAKEVFYSDKDKFPCNYGHMVIYPNGKIVASLPSSTEPSIFLAHKDMDNLAAEIQNAFNKWNGPVPRGLNSGDMDKIIQFFSDETSGVPVLAASTDEDDERIEMLTHHQFRSFQGLLNAKRVHVTGPAGSGKTLLACWTARLLVQRGERILLTCYNRVLAEWLRSSNGLNGFEISSFFSLCRRVVFKANGAFHLPADPAEEQKFWQSTAPALLDEAITKLGPERIDLYDGIIVDEAQDFHPDWWVPLQLLLKDPDKGRLCVFSDSDQQQVYRQSDGYPAGLVPYELLDNCRNTQKIVTYAGKLIDKKITAFPLLPEGVDPRIWNAQDTPSRRSQAVKEAYSWLRDQGFDSSRIAILSPFKAGNPESSLTSLKQMFSLPLKGAKDNVTEWKTGRCIWASTIKAFKGLEADCIILTDCICDSWGGYQSQLYVGATRAKHHLIIIPSSLDGQRSLEKYL
jgi:hypothetical protein